MEIKNIKTVVFDFDGTLIKSNQIKHHAWYDVFAPDQALSSTLEEVLETYLELSRFIIIRKVLERAYGELLPGAATEQKISNYANRYNDLVFNAAKCCAELPGASRMLSGLSRLIPLYCSSHTPEPDLRELIMHRGWISFFSGIYGYPRNKRDTIVRIMEREQVSAEHILVVGDGASDRDSANSLGAHFYKISNDDDLGKVASFWNK